MSQKFAFLHICEKNLIENPFFKFDIPSHKEFEFYNHYNSLIIEKLYFIPVHSHKKCQYILLNFGNFRIFSKTNNIFVLTII